MSSLYGHEKSGATERPALNRLQFPDAELLPRKTLIYQQKFGDDEPERRKNATKLTDEYYDLVTQFYEYGWGSSFHFAPLEYDDSRMEALKRHEYCVAMKLRTSPGDHLLDVGCGIGGPARNIVKFSGCNVTGITCNGHQVARALELNKDDKLHDKLRFVKGDFNEMPFGRCSFDGAYAIESTCHAGDKRRVFAETFETLKPGARFVIYEWIMTDLYDEVSEVHRQIKQRIMEGDGLADIERAPSILEALNDVGFQILESKDMATTGSVPWWKLLAGSWRLAGFRATKVGRNFTRASLWFLQKLRIAPQGSCTAHSILCRGADALVQGGRAGIFSPMFYILAEKPQVPDRPDAPSLPL